MLDASTRGSAPSCLARLTDLLRNPLSLFVFAPSFALALALASYTQSASTGLSAGKTPPMKATCLALRQVCALPSS